MYWKVVRAGYQLAEARSRGVLRINVRYLKQNLPKQPVPKLEDSIKLYLTSVRPLLDDKQFGITSDLAKKFLAGDGAKLQKMLEEKANATENWLALWWLNAAYLEYRRPVVVFSSPGQVLPFVKFNSLDDELNYAASLIVGSLEYKELIDDDKIPIDKMGKDDLDMQQYKLVFGTCRNPAIPRDTQEFNPKSKHIIVAHNNHFFRVDVYGEDNKKLSVKQLVAQMKKCVEQSKAKGPAVGIMSSENRDTWAKAFKKLMADAGNKKCVEEIQKSLYLMCLDKPMPKGKGNDISIASQQFITGGGSTANSGNRWFDKTVQFIVSEDGYNGLTYEHSPAEGVPIGVMCDFLVGYLKKKSANNVPDSKGFNPPAHLNFNLSPDINKEIESASNSINKLANDLDMNCFLFKLYGKDFIKKMKVSPDSFIQMSFQYTFYRMYKQPAAHYEAAATRKYLHGRTETIRSCSIESVAFAKAMLDPKMSPDDKFKALRAGVNSHKKYAVLAREGYGIDRHLLGLKLLSIEKKMPMNPFFSDIAFTKSTHFRLSTSQVPQRMDGFMCFGPVALDGYGCCYNPRKNDIYFAVSSFNSNSETSSEKFKTNLEQTFTELKDLFGKLKK
ncbi:PREDICTED: carnitine O-acetyltransferase-like [Nicrophorus vespilloides]|uniref:Carnitine O-acetyltransferase-like n=1 Tax=Nicrophorus vespilloides TaxID=110193 RepID=A0ABM1MPH2_NICVS|nr:PREDICTED: carnitine O-acetyltransferase-like [Nicrophorus vespilloides]